MFMILMLNTMIMSMIFTSLSHPISLGFILLIQTMLIALISSFYTYSFWLSYILFLIMVGGMLILFTYVTSIASNEQFSSSKSIAMLLMMMIMSSLLLTLILDKTMFYQLIKNNDMTNMTSIINFLSENNIIINKIYNKPNNIISILLINYLLLTLIIVVKITNINYGPLRQKF